MAPEGAGVDTMSQALIVILEDSLNTKQAD